MTRNAIPYLTSFSPTAVTIRDKQILDDVQMHINNNKNENPISQNGYQYVFRQKESDSQIPKSFKYPDHDLSTMKSSSVSIKRPKEYCPLSKKQQIVQNQNVDKELQYLKSSQYRQYLQAVMQGTKNTQDIIRLMKENRNNDVYLAKSQDCNQIKRVVAKRQWEQTDQCQKIKNKQFILIQHHALVNLSPICQRDDFKTNHRTDQRNSQLYCQPYLENSTIVQQSAPQPKLKNSFQNENRSPFLTNSKLCTASQSFLPTQEYLPKRKTKEKKLIIIDYVQNKNNIKCQDQYRNKNGKLREKYINAQKVNEIFISQRQCQSQKYSHQLDSKYKCNEQTNRVYYLNQKQATKDIYAIDFKLSQPTNSASKKSAHVLGLNAQTPIINGKNHLKQGHSHSGSNHSGRKRMSIISLSKQAKINHI